MLIILLIVVVTEENEKIKLKTNQKKFMVSPNGS